MMISEVLLMLEQRRHQKDQNSNLGIDDDDDDEIVLSEAFNDTVDYCERFSKFRTKEAIGAVRNLLFPKDPINNMMNSNSSTVLHKFEAALLANLCPRETIEAKTLIPSLDSKLDDDDCQKLLDEIQTYRSFQC
jgi:DNA-directed RNA polymerase II subunit RPB4